MISVDGHAGDPIAALAVSDSGHRRAGAIALRIVLALSLLLAAALGAVLSAQLHPAKPAIVVPKKIVHRAIVVVPTPAAPMRVIAAPANGVAAPSGAWMPARSITLRVTVRGGKSTAALRAEAEITPAYLPFIGVPNVTSGIVTVPARKLVRIPLSISNLVNGQRYHWRVRVWSASGKTSAWGGGGIFGVSLGKPSAPQLAVTNTPVGAWSRGTRLLLRWTDRGGLAPIALHEYQVVGANMPPHAGPTAWRQISGNVLVLSHMPEGQWQVLVRAVDSAGNRSEPARWTFGLARHPLPMLAVSSASPASGTTSNSMAPVLRWTKIDSIAPILRYEYLLSLDGSVSTKWKRVAPGQSLHLPALTDGNWNVLVRAVDAAGNKSSPYNWHFTLDRMAPLLTTPVLSLPSFTERAEHELLRVGLGKRALVSFAVVADAGGKLVAARTLGMREPGLLKGLAWDGKVSSRAYAPGGTYHMVVTAIDEAGNRTVTTSGPFTLLTKRIVVSISKDQLWAFDGTTLITTTLVTNGGPDTPTLPGIFHVEARDQGFVMHSPWPKSSPLWYPDSPTNFALLYNADGGYFLHDAPWRWHFGPGSNSVAGTPGGSYTGTHGCTNVPYDVMATLFAWADVGTLVQIVP